VTNDALWSGMISLSKFKQKIPISDSLEESIELVNNLLDSY